MDREPKSARYCAECNRLHPAEEGDFWAESSMLGLKITYFALMDGKVYDITGILLFSRNMGSCMLKTVMFWLIISHACRMGWMSACGDLSRYPQSPLSHLIWFSDSRHQWAAEVGVTSFNNLPTIIVLNRISDDTLLRTPRCLTLKKFGSWLSVSFFFPVYKQVTQVTI